MKGRAIPAWTGVVVAVLGAALWQSGLCRGRPVLVIGPATLPNGKVVRAVRLGDEPLITPAMFARLGVPSEGENINGPSVIRVPDWIPANERAHESARYYMYFARHGRDRIGDYIRMAWAARIEGPWHLFRIGEQVPPGERGVLDLGSNGAVRVGGNEWLTYSVGSPEAVVDEARKRIVLYFHAVRRNRKSAVFVSTSPFGLDFNGAFPRAADGQGIRPTPLGGAYFRTFDAGGRKYAFANFGYLHRAAAGDAIWERPWETIDGPLRRAHDGSDDGDGNERERADNPRHCAVANVDGELWVFFTRRADAPERILLSLADVRATDWRAWRATFPPAALLAPELDWEGADLPVTQSRNGAAVGERALRDPALLVDADGSWYLFYCGRGEAAIGAARVLVTEG